MIKADDDKNSLDAFNNKQIIEVLTKISEAITSDLYLEEILKLIVKATADVMDSNICSLMLIDKSGKELILKATQSINEDYNKKPNIKLGDGIIGEAAKTGKTITVLDVRKNNKYINKDLAIKANLCSLLSIPLIFKDNIIGVLNIYTPEEHIFSDNEISIIKSIANQAAIVIENFRLAIESKTIKEELENRKIIEKAKGILMNSDNLSEKEAYNKIRKYCMNKRKTMKEISAAIILTDDLKIK